MSTVIDPNAIFSGAPVSLTYGGVEAGSTLSAPKLSLDVAGGAPDFKNAGGPIKATRGIRTIIPSVEIQVSEITAQKLAWAMPGATADSSESVGVTRAGLDTTLAADPALGATNLKVTSVATVNVGDFVRVGAAGVAATEDNSEVVRVLTVGTAASGGTGLDVENSAGGGMLADYANADEIKTVVGTVLAAPAVAGASNVKVDSVTGLAIGEFIRVGYVGHYETRELSAVGTAGPAGTGLTFVIPLTLDHGLDEWVVKVTTLGLTTLQPVAGRMPSAAHHNVVLTGVGLDGLPLIVELDDALSLVDQDIPFSDDDWSGFDVELEAYGDPNAPADLPWRIKYGA